jgi:hydrogenase nickel incorporation protein HypB
MDLADRPDIPSTRRLIPIQEALLSKNERAAGANRERFRAAGVRVLNVLSSPGSGKTEFLRRTLLDLGPSLGMGVIVGDLATDNDARRLHETGAPAVQIATGTVCHLEADMVGRAAEALGLDGLDLLIIENVGNLVCPATYDLGEDVRVVLLSVTEGEDKPLKYPVIFERADVVVISKIDLAEAVGFDREAAMRNIRKASPSALVFEASAKTGRGMASWYDHLRHVVLGQPRPDVGHRSRATAGRE